MSTIIGDNSHQDFRMHQGPIEEGCMALNHLKASSKPPDVQVLSGAGAGR